METSFDNTPEESLFYFDKPGLGTRFKSIFIDAAVVITLMIIVSYLLNSLKVESGAIRGVAFILVCLYEPISMTLNRTIGQAIMGLRVVPLSSIKDNSNLKKLHLIPALLRYAFKLILGWVSLLTIHSDQYGQAIHDKVANSVVVFK